jgi:hypothetical protein
MSLRVLCLQGQGMASQHATQLPTKGDPPSAEVNARHIHSFDVSGRRPAGVNTITFPRVSLLAATWEGRVLVR